MKYWNIIFYQLRNISKEIGPRGFNGTQGPRGFNGTQGLPGPQGDAGVSGVGNLSACIVDQKALRTKVKFPDADEIIVSYEQRAVRIERSLQKYRIMHGIPIFNNSII